MRNYIFILIFLVLFVLASTPAHAQQIAGQSAVLTSLTARQDSLSLANKDKRAIQKNTIEAVLKRYNSPMADDVESFMQVCEEYELNCYLLPAISGVESGFGNHLLSGSHNPFGWGGGKIRFDSWDDGITTVGKSLRLKYIDRGAIHLDAVGNIYAASPEWSNKVRKFIAEFEKEEAQQELNFTDDDVKL